MSKIICDICGTAYPDTEAECPICGCAKDISIASLADVLMEQEAEPVAEVAFSVKNKKTPAFDEYDEDDEYDEEYEDDEDEYDDEDEDDEDDEEEHTSNAPLVVMLVIVTLLLIAVSAFILVKYFLPNVMGPEVTAPAPVETTEALPAETTELKIPCESLALISGGEIVLENEGDNWLINVMALPENTTDELIYISSDETVVTVNEQGKLTAVGQGTAVITIICGEQEMKCTVTCNFEQEVTEPQETEPEATDPEETEPETTPPETEAPKPVTGVITASTLNIRQTPDANGAIVGLYGKGQAVTILEQKTVGNTLWGRTDKGWISMQFVKLDN